ncbi:MAG TPA: translesion error-prone DNA polymerase V autoproteolytic subunit [Candidatus Brocadiia bacterium]|nr:translesion error-prone DNA polymerase V autoproteolytic subunit [Candidatus Brocadiia bacterium]
MERVPAGFPSPARDYVEAKLDLNEHLVRHPAATFFVKVAGDSMLDAGINSGDILIVDRALEARPGDVVIAVIDGEPVVKRLRAANGRLFLCPENRNFKPMEINPDMEFEIWGVVIHAIHSYRKCPDHHK